MWQKCPVCDGTGNVPNTLSSSSYKTCSVCKGEKIISERTGLPPDYERNKKERENEDIPHGLGDEFPSVERITEMLNSVDTKVIKNKHP